MPDLTVADTIALGENAFLLSGIGSGNIWIEEDFTDCSLLLAQEAILKSLLGTAPSQLEVVVFDCALRGVAAPFSSLKSAGLLSTLVSEQEFESYLSFLKMHVQGVNDVMQGRSNSLREFRSLLNEPIESYKLVVLFADVLLLDDKIKEPLSILLSAGPKAGVTFLIVSPADTELSYLSDKCQLVSSTATRSALKNDYLLRSCSHLVHRAIRTTIDPVCFEEVQSLDEAWCDDSTDGITFALGRYGAELVEVTLGNNREQKHNALITGAVGQGKSNAITVIIHSLCQRYSPEELELYLLDFKEGVTLQPYSGIGGQEWLVHAKTLGLESDVSFGIAVLEYLFGVYEQRMSLFKQHQVQGIKEYRETTGAKMPRILLVIDEFQMLLEERENEKEVASLLSKSARLFRAAGIHMILASQSIANGLELGRNATIFAQIPIRIALKNSVAESEATLGLGNSAAADLRVGQAILNLDYGAISSNRKIRVAYADSDKLQELRRKWWDMRPDNAAQPFIFEGSAAVSIGRFLPDIRALRNSTGFPPKALLGMTVSVNGRPQFVSLSREPGRNIALIGAAQKNSSFGSGHSSHENMAIGILQAAALSLALQDRRGTSRFVICDCATGDNERAAQMLRFSAFLQSLGFLSELLNPAEFSARIDCLANDMESKDSLDEEIYLLGFSLDRWMAPPSLSALCRNGPSVGVHFLGWWQKLNGFEDQIGFGNDAYFDIKVMLFVDARDVQRSLGWYEAWHNEDNRALVSDSAYLEQPTKIIPIASFSSLDETSISSSLL